jgi:hypothetical protein
MFLTLTPARAPKEAAIKGENLPADFHASQIGHTHFVWR